MSGDRYLYWLRCRVTIRNSFYYYAQLAFVSLDLSMSSIPYCTWRRFCKSLFPGKFHEKTYLFLRKSILHFYFKQFFEEFWIFGWERQNSLLDLIAEDSFLEAAYSADKNFHQWLAFMDNFWLFRKFLPLIVFKPSSVFWWHVVQRNANVSPILNHFYGKPCSPRMPPLRYSWSFFCGVERFRNFFRTSLVWTL